MYRVTFGLKLILLNILSGILYGTLTMEYGGKVSIECEKTGYRTEIEFKLKVRNSILKLAVPNLTPYANQGCKFDKSQKIDSYNDSCKYLTMRIKFA